MPPALSVVVVVYDMAREAPRTLHSLSRRYQQGGAELDYEVIVVDDSSSDDGPNHCSRQGLTVIPSGGRLGPAGCRNLAADRAQGPRGRAAWLVP